MTTRPDRTGRGRADVRGRAAAGARRAAAPRPGRPLLRLRGRPAVHRGAGCDGRAAVGDRLPVRVGGSAGAVHPAVGAQLRAGAGRAGDVPRFRGAPPSPAPRDAHLPLRALRADAPAVDGGAPRHPRIRRRPPAARRGVRRSVSDRAPVAARGVAVVLDQEARAALHGRRGAHQRRAEGRRLDRQVRPGAGAAGRRRRGGRRPHPRRPRRLQPVRLRLDPAPPGLARRPGARGRPAPLAGAGARREGVRAVAARPRAVRRVTQPPGRLGRRPVAAPRRPPRSTTTRARRRATGARTSCACASPSPSGKRCATSSCSTAPGAR